MLNDRKTLLLGLDGETFRGQSTFGRGAAGKSGVQTRVVVADAGTNCGKADDPVKNSGNGAHKMS